jgi:hypothetical protein
MKCGSFYKILMVVLLPFATKAQIKQIIRPDSLPPVAITTDVRKKLSAKMPAAFLKRMILRFYKSQQILVDRCSFRCRHPMWKARVGN